MKKNKKGKKSRKIKYLFWAILILILIVLILILIENGSIKNLTEQKEIKRIELKDECSLMFNNIIHQIKTEGNCESLCKNECSSRKINYEKIEFILKDGTCHSCICYCSG